MDLDACTNEYGEEVTVSAWRSPNDGSVKLAYLDDNVVTGRAVERPASNPNLDVANDLLGNGVLVVDCGNDRVTAVELSDRTPLTRSLLGHAVPRSAVRRWH